MRNKLFLFAIALSFSLLSCNQAGASAGNDLKDDQKASKISVSQQDKKVADKPIKLTKSEFLTKVMD